MKRSAKTRIAELERENTDLQEAFDYCCSRLVEVLRERDEFHSALVQTTERLEQLAFVSYRKPQ